MRTINTYYIDYEGLQDFVEDNKEAFNARENRSVLVQAFCGISCEKYIRRMTEDILRLVPGAEIIGTTTCGVIMDGRVSDFESVLSFSFFRKCTVKTCLIDKGESDSFELGLKLAQELQNEEAKLMLLFSSGMDMNCGKLVRGIEHIMPKLPVAGGNAGNAHRHDLFYVFDRYGVTKCGAVGAVISGGNLKVTQHSHFAGSRSERK